MHNIYFDESGNTGDNLLDKDQPFYVLSSNNYSDEEVEILLTPLKDVRSDELHFKRIKKHKRYQEATIEIFNNNLISENHIKFYYVDKKYALVCNVVDKIIEPLFHRFGHNLYKKGQNMGYANILYLVGSNMINKGLFERFLYDFQFLIRNKTNDAIEKFYRTIYEIEKNGNEDIKYIFYPISQSSHVINDLIEDLDKYFLDLAVPTFTGLCCKWGEELNSKFKVIHDDSKQIEFWKDYLNFISSDLMPKQEVGYDYRKHTYPLMIESINFVNSKTCRQIQLADLISSSITYCMNAMNNQKGKKDEFADKLIKSRLANIESGNPILFSPKFTPKDLGTEDDRGIDPLEYLVQNTKRMK